MRFCEAYILNSIPRLGFLGQLLVTPLDDVPNADFIGKPTYLQDSAFGRVNVLSLEEIQSHLDDLWSVVRERYSRNGVVLLHGARLCCGLTHILSI